MAHVSELGHLGSRLRGELLVHGRVHGRAAPVLQRPVCPGCVRDLLEAVADRDLRAHHPAGQSTLEAGGDRPAGILRLHPALALRHDGDGVRRRPARHLPRPGVDVALLVRDGRVQAVRAAPAGGRGQVLHPGLVLLRHPALRHLAAVRPHRQHHAGRHPRGNRQPAGRRSDLDAGDEPAGGGVRLQGRGCPLPHVDAGRVRGIAHIGDGLHGRCVQGGQFRGLCACFWVRWAG